MDGTLLLTLVLTIVATLGSWIAARHYSEHAFNKSLRTFALKAAEKVDNLSKELDRLSIYLQQSLDAEHETVDELLLAKDLHVDGALHVINTLKSINDLSLSDWRGVLGDEIEAQREEREEREQDLRALIERVESIYSPELETQIIEQSEYRAALTEKVASIHQELRAMIAHISGTRPRVPSRRVVAVESNCPNCRSSVAYKQKAKKGPSKIVKCRSCGDSLISTYDGVEFQLTARKSVSEDVECSECGNVLELQIDNFPGGPPVDVTCTKCGVELRVTRAKDGLRVRIMPSDKSPPEGTPDPDADTIDKVRTMMPAQPWPVGAHRHLAQELGLPVGTVRKAVTTLIKRGDFLLQIDGQLYKPAEQ